VTPRVTHKSKLDDEYRAIGRYVVEFSQLVRMMRSIVSEYVAKDGAERHIVDVLMGETTAQPIANAFFELCRTKGGLDPRKSRPS
jgi:hypothetical protein